MSAPATERKRWRLARLCTWTAIVGGAALFWIGVASALVAWVR